MKELEADGVGRPSTYASILSTIQEREYVKKEGGKFTPTELGMVVTDLLLESFNDIFDVQLHGADGRGARRDRRRQARLARGHGASSTSGSRRIWNTPSAHMTDIKRMEKPTDLICEKCGKPHGDQMGQARQLHRLHRISGMHQYARADGDLPDIERPI